MAGRPVPSAGLLAQAACLLEVSARKPGNVHRCADFADATWLDFALAAAAIAGPLDRAEGRPLGATILEAVQATRGAVATNVNLGLVLLLAPLAAVPPGVPLRAGVTAILASTTVADARGAYEAIRLARPGGLGDAPEGQDVSNQPTCTLLEAMRLAAGRDLVARQYATDFAAVFDRFVPTLAHELSRPGRSLEAAIVLTYLDLLAREPDTLIARKRGLAAAREASDRAAGVLAAGWPDAPGSDEAFCRLDGWLRGDGHARNPGATADLVGAGLFVALREGIIDWPIGPDWMAGPQAIPTSPAPPFR